MKCILSNIVEIIIPKTVKNIGNLIRQGIPDRRVMRSVRVSSEELLSQLRQKDITDPGEVEYAILEPNGQISVIKKAEQQPPTLSQLDMKVPERGMMHMIICDGKINEKNLSLAGKDMRWLEAFLLTKGMRIDDVFLLLADDGDTVRLYRKEERS